MPRRTLSGQLDAALDALLRALPSASTREPTPSGEALKFYGPSRPEPKPEGPAAIPERLARLVTMARDLVALPREDFRTNLKAEIERTALMTGTAKAALEPSGGVRRVPVGYHTVAPYLTVKDSARALDFYTKAFGAVEVMRLRMPDGGIGHAEIQIGDSHIMLSDEFPEFGARSPESLGGSPVALQLYVENTDAVLAQAAAAGATITSAAANRDYGERSGSLTDPFGHKWTISTHLEDLTAEQYRQRSASGPSSAADVQRATKAAPAGSAVRPGFRTAGVHLTVAAGVQAIEFYKRAFNAVENEAMRFLDPDGRVAHAEIAIGDSGVMIGGETIEYNRYGPEHFGGSPVKMHIYVEDVDALTAQAIAAGAKVIRPLADQFYGDRSGQIEDPFGHLWILSSHIEDVSPEEIERRTVEFMGRQVISGLREGFTAVTPYITVHRGEELVSFIKSVFGAVETFRAPGSASGMHVEARIGNSMVMLGLAPAHSDETLAALHVYVDDVDATYRRALDAGASSITPPTDHEYGERGASVKDNSGNYWYLARRLAGPAIAEGLRSVTPYFHPRSAARMIDFLKRAFDAEEIARYQDPSGVVLHAHVTIQGAAVEMGEAHGPYQPMPSATYLYVPDVDTAYQRAMEAGGVSLQPPADQPYGDRNAWVRDPEGHTWYIAMPLKNAGA